MSVAFHKNQASSFQTCLIVLAVIHYAAGDVQIVEETNLSREECHDIGLNSDTLKCSSCHMMGQFNLEELMTDCLRCCKDKGKDGEHEVVLLTESRLSRR